MLPTAPPPPPGVVGLDAPPVLDAYERATAVDRVLAAAIELGLFVLCFGLGWLLWWVVLWDHSTTPAKAVLKLRVVDARTGAHASSARMAAHELLAKLLLPLVLVTAAIALVDDDRRGLWEHVTRTAVVRDRLEEASTDPR
jgi:uncharacterized RDD family membrane protein YckC